MLTHVITCFSVVPQADIVITTYNLVQKEVQLPKLLKSDKSQQDKPATDEVLDIFLGVFFTYFVISSAFSSLRTYLTTSE